jgi:hypothetical protein
MESSVASKLSPNIYTADIHKLYKDDNDVPSELYEINIFNNVLHIAPGKPIIDDKLKLTYMYVYAIKNEKVVANLGVYELLTDKPEKMYDISTLDDLLLFDVYYTSPSKIKELEIVEKDIFDYIKKHLLLPKDSRETKLYNGIRKHMKENDMVYPKIIKIIGKSLETGMIEDTIDQLKEQAVDDDSFKIILSILERYLKVSFTLTNKGIKISDYSNKLPETIDKVDTEPTKYIIVENRAFVSSSSKPLEDMEYVEDVESDKEVVDAESDKEDAESDVEADKDDKEDVDKEEVKPKMSLIKPKSVTKIILPVEDVKEDVADVKEDLKESVKVDPKPKPRPRPVVRKVGSLDKSEAKPDAKSDAKSDAKFDAKSDAKSEAKANSKTNSKSKNSKKNETKPDETKSKVVAKQKVEPNQKVEPVAVAKSSKIVARSVIKPSTKPSTNTPTNTPTKTTTKTAESKASMVKSSQDSLNQLNAEFESETPKKLSFSAVLKPKLSAITERSEKSEKSEKSEGSKVKSKP